ncbi:MAG: M23 family metallopeptidase [Deferribacteraceae bacterium]|jgi:murein DD-endopeptidase MepM/ murein hydrolase activator NlpD|nr:M23 family metallopeptidase [Deferribacteraceae bacterium]
MKKKYTVMFFGTDRMGKVRTVTISQRLIVSVLLFFMSMSGIFGYALLRLNSLYSERNDLITYSRENNLIKSQLSLYTQKLENISAKIADLNDLEYKIRDLVTLQKGNIPLKPIAVGGKEVDLIREYSSVAVLNEKDFFYSLEGTLEELSYEIAEREANLSDLASTLEEKRLVVLYTPTLWPVKGWLSGQFGYRVSPFTGRHTFHEGIDIAARFGSDICATAKGIVVYAGQKPGYGYLVTIDHGYGYLTRYGHNSNINVKVGDTVEKGQIIAKVGTSGRSTGPHSHYEVLVNGIPINPLKFIIEEGLDL